MNKLYAILAASALVAGAVYGLVQYGRALERADNAEMVAELQQVIVVLGLEIQKQESLVADNTRKSIEANRELIDAIQTNDHATEEIKRLEQLVEQERAKEKARGSDKPGGIPDVNYRIIITDSTVRVWEEARSGSGLPASTSASVLQKRLSAVAGDDINESIKYAIGQYNRCAIKYNKLWPTCDRLIEASNKPAP